MEALFTPFAVFFGWINNIHNPFLFILPIVLIAFFVGLNKNFSLRRFASMFPLWLLVLSFIFGGLFIISAYPILINPGVEEYIKADHTGYFLARPLNNFPEIIADYSSTFIPPNQLFFTLGATVFGFILSIIFLSFTPEQTRKNLKIFIYSISPFIGFSVLLSAWYLINPGAVYVYAYDAILVPFVFIYTLSIALTWITVRTILFLRSKLSNSIYLALVGLVTLASLSVLIIFSFIFGYIDNYDSGKILNSLNKRLETSCEKDEHWAILVKGHTIDCNTIK
jgi:hypothetical protein